MTRVNNLTPRGLAYNVGHRESMYPLQTIPPETGARWHSGPEYTRDMEIHDKLMWVFMRKDDNSYVKTTHYESGLFVVKTPRMTMATGPKGEEMFHKAVEEEFLKLLKEYK